MAKVKISKKSTRIDMTAMCDVAFLLLSFFIMTSTAKVPEPKPVDTPASTVIDKLPERGLITVTVGDSSVFFGMSDRDLRATVIKSMGKKYGIGFSESDVEEFVKMDGFGVAIEELPALIKKSSTERNQEGLQKGIPFADSTNNQLADWIKESRAAYFAVNNKDIKVAIKGDSKEKYPTVKKVLDILQKQEVNNFFMVTGLRSAEDF